MKLREQVWIVIRLAADHHAGEVRQLLRDDLERAQAAIEDERQTGKLRTQTARNVVAQRRNLAILLRAQPLQHRPSRMDDEHRATGTCHGLDEAHEEFVLVHVRHRHRVDRDSALHGHRDTNACAHRCDTVRDQARLSHEARSEASALHAIARAAAVQVDLIVAVRFAGARRDRKLPRIAAAQLQRDRMLGIVEAQKPLCIPAHDSRRRNHLGI